MEATLQEILDARERRVIKQQALRAQYGKPILCFTMNIAGPEKCNALIRWGFACGNRWLAVQLADLSVLHQEILELPTGCEAFYVIDTPAEALKLRALQIEDSAPVARLFDMDVLDACGKKLQREDFGFPQRKCLICGNPAYICGRSRTHSVAELQAKTTALLREAMEREDWAHIGQLAQQSLLFEVCTTPKPGLVDCRNNGSHRDMDIFTFMASASALQSYFAHCAQIGIESRHMEPQAVFSQLRFPGKLAEAAMFQATHGVNTHKGIIFSLGILCAAAGRLLPEQRNAEAILRLCAEMTRDLTAQDLRSVTTRNAATTGEALYAQHGITGVRGQAEAGFPQVLLTGLPTLEKGLENGLSLNDAGCAALLALLASTQDTNLIHRSSLHIQQEVSANIAQLLQQSPYPSREILEKLDDAFISQNLSPGGSADLLALTYFLHLLAGGLSA